jgi:UDP-N-acetylglucosamine--N-acetylmuramyl-(pentapeptide) pyrophosphoryl-undecaprenol N-acetylglucosamine transferase
LRVLLAGGGSGGSAAPVIAVAEAIANRWPDASFLYVGTTEGPERELLKTAGLPYEAVRTGRFRRYATWRNLIDPGLVALGVGQAAAIVRRFRPDVAFGAGGFATVPPLLAARLLRVRIAIHQQDVVPGLANRMLAPFAAQLTVALPDTRLRFERRTARVVGNPVRRTILEGDATRARDHFDLTVDLPVVLVTGGGTGALRLNELAVDAARELANECQLIHLTGAGRSPAPWSHANYRRYEFLAEPMADALAAADVIVTRAGMSALTEVAALSKAAIVVPMPDSHQEANAAVFARHGAGSVCPESTLSGQGLARQIRGLLADPSRREALGAAASLLLPPDAADAICAGIAGLVSGSVGVDQDL